MRFIYLMKRYKPALAASLALVSTTLAAQDFTVGSVSFADYHSASAAVLAQKNTMLRAKVNATVTRVLPAVGAKLAAGQLLIELDSRAAAADIEAINAQLQELGVKRQLLRKNLARAQQLRQKNALSNSDFDNVSSQKHALDARAKMLQAKLATAKLHFADYKIYANAPALLVEKYIEAGELASPGQQLMFLQQQGLRLEAKLANHSIAQIDFTQPALLQLADSSYPLAAASLRLLPAKAQQAARTVRIDLPLDFAAKQLAVGQLVELKLALKSAPSNLYIPSCYLQERNEMSFVKMQVAGKARLQLVRQGAKRQREQQSFVEIIAGLAQGDVLLAGDSCE